MPNNPRPAGVRIRWRRCSVGLFEVRCKQLGGAFLSRSLLEQRDGVDPLLLRHRGKGGKAGRSLKA